MATLSEKIGQMLMVGIRGESLTREERSLIEQYPFGGFILFSHNCCEPGQLLSLCQALWDTGSELRPFIAVDQEGNLYVTDSFNHRIQKFDSNGNFVAKFGGEASDEGKGLFNDPQGVAVDSQGNIYVVDSNFLQKLDWQGNFIAQWPRTNDLDRAGFLTVDKQGDIYILARASVTTATEETFDLIFVKKFRQS